MCTIRVEQGIFPSNYWPIYAPGLSIINLVSLASYSDLEAAPYQLANHNWSNWNKRFLGEGCPTILRLLLIALSGNQPLSYGHISLWREYSPENRGARNRTFHEDEALLSARQAVT